MVRALLQLKGCISYCALKLQFDLDDEQIEALKAEIIEVQGFGTDQDGKFLVLEGNQPPIFQIREAPTFTNSIIAIDKAVANPLSGIFKQTTLQEAPTLEGLNDAIHRTKKTVFKTDDAERRQITIMFRDLAGSTKLSNRRLYCPISR